MLSISSGISRCFICCWFLFFCGCERWCCRCVWLGVRMVGFVVRWCCCFWGWLVVIFCCWIVCFLGCWLVVCCSWYCWWRLLGNWCWFVVFCYLIGGGLVCCWCGWRLGYCFWVFVGWSFCCWRNWYLGVWWRWCWFGCYRLCRGMSFFGRIGVCWYCLGLLLLCCLDRVW